MFEKTKEFVSKHRRICTGVCMAIPAGIAFYAAYRAGCQHGVSTVQRNYGIVCIKYRKRLEER